MSQGLDRTAHHGGSAPATPGFNAVAPEWLPGCGAAKTAAPAIPAAESTLGSHPCVALSSAQVLPEWITITSSCNAFAANGDYPLNFVSHSRGSVQKAGGRGQAAEGRKQKAGSRRQAAGGRRQAAGRRKQAAGSRRQEAESRKHEAGCRVLPPAACVLPPVACRLQPAAWCYIVLSAPHRRCHALPHHQLHALRVGSPGRELARHPMGRIRSS